MANSQVNEISRRFRPMMLKDFLRDDTSVSCMKSSFKKKSTVAVVPPIVLLRSWSKKAAATKISAIVKLLQLANSLKSPSVLPRKLRRRRRKDESDISGDVSAVKVKVKDILRWRSFRDVVEENSSLLDFSSSPNRSTVAAATTTTTTTSSCSKSSSWCESDFTAEELPPWGGENNVLWGKNATTLRDCKGDWQFEESDQKSPVSVLDSPFTQVEDFVSPFHPILADIQKCNTRRNHEQHFEEEIVGFEGADVVEEKANLLLSYLKEGSKVHANDQVILDFFMHELSINGKLQDDEFDCKILRFARSWINDEFDESYEWEVEKKRASYVEDMEKGMCWNNFKQEQEEVSMELGFEVLDDLMDDLLIDFLVR
ncbi:hypothetical protein ACS0TY_019504 [Phlomoides rotata]